jgi:hypothetical protein
MALRPNERLLCLVLKTAVTQPYNPTPCNATNDHPIFLTPIQTNQTEELIPSLFPLFYTTEDTTGNGRSARFLHASHDHAKMARLHDYSHALGLENFHYRMGNVFCNPFLDL